MSDRHTPAAAGKSLFVRGVMVMLRLSARALVSALSVPFAFVSSASGQVPSGSLPAASRVPGCEAWRHRAADLHEQSRLLEARDALLQCLREECSVEEHHRCQAARARLQHRIPRLAVRVLDRHGHVLDDARVFIDGRFAVGGSSVEVDPGVHLVRTEQDEHLGRVQRVQIATGERKVLPVRLRARPKPKDERREMLNRHLQLIRPDDWPMPEAAWALTGLGVASLAGAIILDVRAASGLEGMQSCAPRCDEDVVDAVEREVQFSRVAGGLSVLSLATAAWFALAESPADVFAPRTSGAPRLRMLGGAGGMRVILTTSFDENLLMQGRNPLVRPPEKLPPLKLPPELLNPWAPMDLRPRWEF